MSFIKNAIFDGNDFVKVLKGKFDSLLVVDMIYGYLCDLWGTHIEWSKDKAFWAIEEVEFPEPKNININMMPFILGRKESIPKEYHEYWPMICQCLLRMDPIAVRRSREKNRDIFKVDSDRKSMRKVGYLTIDEAWCEAGNSHRRGGLHTDANLPGNLKPASLYIDYRWGGREPHNGIYMANNVASSCRIWRNIIEKPGEVQGMYGNMDHLRPLLSTGEMVKPNTLYWLGDRTPHESLKLKRRTYRHFFRVVSSELSVWFECSSTKNPLGVVPPKSTYVYLEDKFANLQLKFSPAVEVARILEHYSRFQPEKKECENDSKKRMREKLTKPRRKWTLEELTMPMIEQTRKLTQLTMPMIERTSKKVVTQSAAKTRQARLAFLAKLNI